MAASASVVDTHFDQLSYSDNIITRPQAHDVHPTTTTALVPSIVTGVAGDTPLPGASQRAIKLSDGIVHDWTNQHLRGQRFLGIRWAPFHVPFERRLQTLTVWIHCLVFLIGPTFTIFACVNPLLRWFMIPYLCYVFFSKAGDTGSTSWRSEWYRNLHWWKRFAAFFPAELHKTADLPSDRKYIFGYHPHGIIAHGTMAALATEGCHFSMKFPGITNSLLTLDSSFNLPIFREYILLAGIRSVSEKSIFNFLTTGGSDGNGKGRAVTIVLGGAREALEAHPGTLRLVMKDRYGFVRRAIRIGADLVPILNFGENNLYDDLGAVQRLSIVQTMQKFILRTCKLTIPTFSGRGALNYDFGLMPHRRPMHIVVGEPIQVQQNDHPGKDEVERLHKVYCDKLQHMWDTYKDQYAPNRRGELEFI